MRQTHDGLQAAEDSPVDEHLANLHVDGQASQVVPQRGEEMVVGVTRTNLPQQVDGVTDRLGLRGIQGPAQKVLRGTILTFLPEGGGRKHLQRKLSSFFHMWCECLPP